MIINYNAEKVIETAQRAGMAIMNIYNDPALADKIEMKGDDSPLTLADKAAHEIIVQELSELFTYPILSEESDPGDYESRKEWRTYWLVDPLDGTKEFIKRNGEFTVNIALIHDRRPVLGVIFVPAKKITYVGAEIDGAYKIGENLSRQKIQVNNKDEKRIAVRSKSHASPEEDEVLKRYDIEGTISRGSSLKFCMVAEGLADVYYRHGPTMEWDTAAGQAVLLAAGGRMYHGSTEENEFLYNKEDLLNGSFLCLGF